MARPLYLAFIWHMHQPYYRDLVTGECSMPWVRLHGTKDYLDMVQALEPYPNVHQTFNLVPSLLDQLEDYLPPQNRSDRFLDLSRKPAAALTPDEQRFVLEWFFLANPDRMIKPYARYHDLWAKRGAVTDERQWPQVRQRFRTQDYLDLQVWFNLAWIDPVFRVRDPALAALEAKGRHFTEAEKTAVLAAQAAILQQVIPAYAAAQARGQVELSTTPYYHPILPLLCDVRSAREAIPQLPIPSDAIFQHPEDARTQVRLALARHEQRFGARPDGMWPSEGSVSEAVVRLAIEEGVRWLATDEEILWRTLKQAPSDALYRPHLVRRGAGKLAMLFRDRELSDLIGFTYSQWKAQDAVGDLLRRLEDIALRTAHQPAPALVSIILDGENAWEYYPQDGGAFLDALYGALSRDDRFRAMTVSEFLAQYPLEEQDSLPEVFAGSWIDGNFATWIGHPEKNTAWVFLSNVRQELAQAPEAPADAWKSLYIAEGSDWMWWLGDTHSSMQDEEFDRLFRAHLGNVYRLMKREVPGWLQLPITRNAVQPVSEPTAPIQPTIDGIETTYYEWLYAGGIDLRKSYGAIQRGAQLLQAVRYGIDERRDYFRLECGQRLETLGAWRLEIEFVDRGITIQAEPGGDAAGVVRVRLLPEASGEAQGAYRRILELAVPLEPLKLEPGQSFHLRFSLWRREELVEQHPAQGAFHLHRPADVEARFWSV